MRTFIMVHVYRSKLGDCTNGGVSAIYDFIYVEAPRGNYREDEISPELAFTVEKRAEGYWAAKPILRRPGLVGPMSGGNLASTSDARMPFVLHIHDRWETSELNDLLSR